MPFVKGDPRINRAGKKPGTVDKKWQSIQAIWKMFMEEYPKLKPNEKAKHMADIFRLHFERAIAQLPKDQNDSILNANKMMEELKQLEADTLNGFKKTGMDSRKASLQTEADPAKH